QNGRHLSRDLRMQVHTLRSIGWTHKEIANKLKCSVSQVQYTLTGPVTPKKRKGRPGKLSEDRVDELVLFVTGSREGRRMTYLELSMYFSEWDVSDSAIRRALTKRGFRRRVALKKCPISEQNRRKRLEWAQMHVHWTEEQWGRVLWTDETWVTPGRHRKTWVTRRPGEELDPTCLVDRIQRMRGWMFWGCFYGGKLGQGIFWEKDWGKITSASYTSHVTPVIEGMMRLVWEEHGEVPIFQQDNAPSHTADATLADLAQRGRDFLGEMGIVPMDWPPFSPDLNPIETLWNIMKDKIGRVLPENQNVSYDRLRQVVKEAWESITEEDLWGLIRTMRQRCLDVIAANGMHTKW
ncbi:hypothetical protein BJ508DRAFT_200594, partial [Ascobolus immersus RN42]